jgi:anti-sigma regulatory factor (Ser/Thr protein kinase)
MLMPHTEGFAPVLATNLPPDPVAVAEARHALDCLVGRVCEDTLASLRLAVSELVTNGVRYGSAGGRNDEVGLHVYQDAERVRVEVYDQGPGFDAEEAAADDFDFESTGGRGLFIVAQLSERWGTWHDGRNCVWAEFRSCGPGAAGATRQ